MEPNRPSVPVVDPLLNMGIWAEDGGWVALPKELFPTRNDAKRFAVREMEASWIDVRVKTTWMKDESIDAFNDFPYRFANAEDSEAFECWLIR